MSQVKKILIAPRYTQDQDIQRASATAELSDYFLDRDYLPMMGFFDTKFNHKDEALDLARKYLSQFDALVLQGGSDICSSLYSQKPESNHLKNEAFELIGSVAKFRDVFELALIEIALEKNIPILGICRGMQILNIFFGGSLHQHLDSRWIKHIEFDEKKLIPKRGKSHEVEIKPNSFLSTCLSKTSIFVNSEHHQGVDRLGQGLIDEATSSDGLVEALSFNNGKVLGLQWHPELDLQDVDQLKILNHWLKGV